MQTYIDVYVFQGNVPCAGTLVTVDYQGNRWQIETDATGRALLLVDIDAVNPDALCDAYACGYMLQQPLAPSSTPFTFQLPALPQQQGQYNPAQQQFGQPVPASGNGNKKVLVTVIVVLSVLLLAVGGWLAYTHFIKDKDADSEMSVDEELAMAEDEPQEEPVAEEAPASSEEFVTYSNDRYNFSVQYPSDFGNKTESENGDGCTLYGPQGAVMKAFAYHNAMGNTLKQLYEDQKLETDLNCDFRDNYFVASGFNSGMYYMYKEILSDDVVYHCEIRFPESLENFSPTARKVISSFTLSL